MSSQMNYDLNDMDFATPVVPKASLEQRLCVHALMDGCVDAFVEFFTLSHPEPPCIGPYSDYPEHSEKVVKNPKFLQQWLVQLEKSVRIGDFVLIHSSFSSLLDYFVSVGNLDKALEYATQKIDHAYENGLQFDEAIGRVTFSLILYVKGNIHESISGIESAISLFKMIPSERRPTQWSDELLSAIQKLFLLKEFEISLLKPKLFVKKPEMPHIVGIPHFHAENTRLLNSFDNELSRTKLNIEELCKTLLDLAIELHDFDKVITSCDTLVELYNSEGQYHLAIEYLHHEYVLARTHDKHELIAKYSARLAELYQQIANYPKSKKYLKISFFYSKDTNKNTLRSIGKMFAESDSSSAEIFLKSSFKEASEELNFDDANYSKVQLGLIRMTKNFDGVINSYLDVLKTDTLTPLQKWAIAPKTQIMEALKCEESQNQDKESHDEIEDEISQKQKEIESLFDDNMAEDDLDLSDIDSNELLIN
eukprot:TRINITY_DN2717_c0_g1_i1.p1 TRINITY_DN2717_c0_g1~~TRINITY_DN2717_c0_g1_i1.p1  ORF type:complete len:479 (+),score=127.65 TRINITY_DN2717_c0_g1_i1:63-1499(+)